MWFKRFDSSELTAEVIAAMKRDGLTLHESRSSEQLVIVTTDNDWMANKWAMSKRTRTDDAHETFLDRLAKIGAANFVALFVLAVLAVAWVLWRDRR